MVAYLLSVCKMSWSFLSWQLRFVLSQSSIKSSRESTARFCSLQNY